MEAAPYFAEIDGSDHPAEAGWITAADGVRLRLVVWRGGDAGTVFIFSGRTEYAEKYALVATELIAKGFTVATLDWRGQGLSDRLAADQMLGHVRKFSDYQLDVVAALDALNDLGVPRPLHLIGHSMGGCIGLRALANGQPFERAGFSGPMWGIKTEGFLSLLAPFVPQMASAMGLGLLYAPGTSKTSFMMTTPFEDNTLTTDPERLKAMQAQAAFDPRLTLGGPSLHWLAQAFAEMKNLLAAPRPETPTVTFLGALEAITDAAKIKEMSSNWASEELIIIDGAKHELMMERDEVRSRVLNGYAEHFLNA